MIDSVFNRKLRPEEGGQAISLRRDVRRWVRTIVLFVAVIWIVGLVDIFVFGGQLRTYGILPRTERGLWGILFAPLLHGGIGHLIANTSGILVFGGLVILRSEAHFWVVTLVGTLASGIGTWLFGRPAFHIGASGVLFAYFGYLLFTGWFERRLGSIILSVLVLLGWGSTIFGVLPVHPMISWEGHLFGLLGGIACARLLARRPR
ncbi:MAG: rhomboid family intramembrane serine protease [Syntrophobacteraceae bacterium]